MIIASEAEGETFHYYADVVHNGLQICRLGFAGPAIAEKEVHRRLAVKAQLWIDGYLSRPHTGTLAFGMLE